jgi:hypothetical protein
MLIFKHNPKILSEPDMTKIIQLQNLADASIPNNASDSNAGRNEEETYVKLGRSNNTLESDKSETESPSEKTKADEKKCPRTIQKLKESCN